ncbi:MAG TPA: polyprenyl synthetase family protein [Firmicutes bacterium]|nr:polyprenyl synthetase family protein [Bacillota bacterium]
MYENLLSLRIKEINEALAAYFVADKDCYREIMEAINYSLCAGGKRLRPVLCLAAAEFAGMDYQKAMGAACALELIHTYSLIHDDLPAMDNDDLRRGKPTNHKVFGEDMAILAGDGLLTYAFELLAAIAEKEAIPPERVLKTIKDIAHHAGIKGMVGGQALDVKAKDTVLDRHYLDLMHRHKTGALIKTSLRSGCILAGRDDLLALLSRYADKIGLAFQIIDDYLDVAGDEAKLGKKAGSDLRNKKATYITLLGKEAALKEAETLYGQAVALLNPHGERAAFLKFLAKKIVFRDM